MSAPLMAASTAPSVPVQRADEDLHHVEAVAEAFALGAVEQVMFLADGLMNHNWRLVTDRGSVAVKLIRDASTEHARRNLRVAALLARAGVPMCAPLLADGDPVLEIDSFKYCVLPWVDGEHRPGTDLALDQVQTLGMQLGRVHAELRAFSPETLPPPPATMGSKAATAVAATAEADRFLGLAALSNDDSDREVVGWLERRKRLIAANFDQYPESEVVLGPVGWTHGDFQHRNIIWRGDEIVAIIDWDKLRVRPYGEEVVRTATLQFGGEQGWLDVDRVAAFVAGYRSVIPISSAELADAVHRLWWKRLTDFWQLEFHYDRGDRSCDHLFFSGERFLHWWTPRRSGVLAAFT